MRRFEKYNAVSGPRQRFQKFPNSNSNIKIKRLKLHFTEEAFGNYTKIHKKIQNSDLDELNRKNRVFNYSKNCHFSFSGIIVEILEKMKPKYLLEFGYLQKHSLGCGYRCSKIIEIFMYREIEFWKSCPKISKKFQDIVLDTLIRKIQRHFQSQTKIFEISKFKFQF